ncbi:fibronectin type III domain-containing protein [Streptomyces sp. NPDC054775]
MNPAGRRVASAAATAVVLTTAGGLLTALATPASAAVSCASPVYKRQFFANTTFSGTPKKTDCDSTISENWGTGRPTSALPVDNFSVRWTVTRDFGSGGPFALTASAQDGIRVYLDGSRKIDLWKNVSSTVSRTVNLTVPSGKHTLRVDYVNWTRSANVKFAYAPRTSATVDKVRPLAPAGTSVSYDRATVKARLTWSKNKEMDLAGYRVYRRPKSSTGWTRLATTTATSYTDTTLPVTGAAYYYEIRAYDKAGNESAGTADQAVTTVDRTPPPVPAGPSVTREPEALRVRWSAAEGAASYRVYRATGADGTYTRVGTTAQVSYLDASAAEGTTYYYRVTALDSAGNESARSVAVSGTLWDLTPPSAVTGVTVTRPSTASRCTGTPTRPRTWHGTWSGRASCRATRRGSGAPSTPAITWGPTPPRTRTPPFRTARSAASSSMPSTTPGTLPSNGQARPGS